VYTYCETLKVYTYCETLKVYTYCETLKVYSRELTVVRRFACGSLKIQKAFVPFAHVYEGNYTSSTMYVCMCVCLPFAYSPYW
jgi:hypothetical protein